MSFWTDENRETAKRLALAGHSGAQICQAMGAPSRNAVIGMLFRMGVNRSRTPPAPKVLKAPTVKRHPHQNNDKKFGVRRFGAKPVLVSEDNTSKSTGGVALLDLRFQHCRWPLHAEGHEPRFCGHDKGDAKAYCAAHAAKAYAAPKKPLARAPVESGAAYRHEEKARWRGVA